MTWQLRQRVCADRVKHVVPSLPTGRAWCALVSARQQLLDHAHLLLLRVTHEARPLPIRCSCHWTVNHAVIMQAMQADLVRSSAALRSMIQHAATIQPTCICNTTRTTQAQSIISTIQLRRLHVYKACNVWDNQRQPIASAEGAMFEGNFRCHDSV